MCKPGKFLQLFQKGGGGMNKIEIYVDGISHDLESVVPKEGHPLVIDSIKEQARRLGAIAEHNNKYLVDMIDEFYDILTNHYEVVELKEYDGYSVIPKEEFIRLFEVYLKWGLDAVDHFDKVGRIECND